MFEGNQLLSLINRLRGAFIGRDEGICVPFVDYAAVGFTGVTTNSYLMLASCYDKLSLIKWTQTVFVSTTNNGSNYWTVQLDDGTSAFASFNTGGIAANAWAAFIVTSFTQPTGVPPSGFIGISCTKTGAPGALIWAGANLRAM